MHIDETRPARASCRGAAFGVSGADLSIASAELVAYICKAACLQAQRINQAKWICLTGSASQSRVLGLLEKRFGIRKQRTVKSTAEDVINLHEGEAVSLQIRRG